MRETFADHFSRVAGAYAEHRPRYPPELFAWLASLAPGRSLAWDCATGNGQAAAGLAGHFARVIATDASADQLAAARPTPGVEYRVARSEQSGLESATADLVTVAQALHWFDLPAFYAEVRRVLVGEGVVAAWTYRGATLNHPQLTGAVERFMLETVGPYWPSERWFVQSGYQTLPFPFKEIAAPPFVMQAQWTMDQLVAYVGTWSAVGRYRDVTGRDPLPLLVADLSASWGPPGDSRLVTWPVNLRAGRV
ncbi:MAG TPA: class I SAM-dependent methyltransferase [Gemmatimonadales bacterium]|nr:class I SAM-dependent methyltransferase [Gemmatimonadales bacterium]